MSSVDLATYVEQLKSAQREWRALIFDANGVGNVEAINMYRYYTHKVIEFYTVVNPRRQRMMVGDGAQIL